MVVLVHGLIPTIETNLFKCGYEGVCLLKVLITLAMGVAVMMFVAGIELAVMLIVA